MNLQKLLILGLFCFLSTLSSLYAQDWQMKKAPMMTPWSETIDVNNVLPEYPRPQMVRKEWLNLNGIWDLRKGIKGEAYNATSFTYDKKILVPFPIESALSGVMEESDSQCYWYRRTLTIPKTMKGKNILLHFDAVDWETVVYVNGIKVGEHTGGYDPFYFDITSALKDKGEQELVVYTYDNTGGEGQPRGKQALNKWGCWYTPVSGIWQTVWLEPVNPVYIENLMIKPDLDSSSFKMRVYANKTVGVTININLFDKEGNKVATLENAKVGRLLTLPIDNPHLWSVDDPYLYDLDVTIMENGVPVDKIASYCGMRKIEVKKVGDTPRIFLNGKQIFQMGPLDQGWWPDGLYTAPSDEALLFDIKAMKEIGFNMIRKHIKIEPARWYMHCDREGILVWQDLPSPNLPSGYEDYAKKNFEDESKRIIQSFRNHPSIIQWVVFNEGWGQYDTERVTRIVQGEVGQSLVCCASGWVDAPIGDIKDSHSYPDPSCPLDDNRAAVCGEYGGITLKVQGHVWPGGDFQYTTVETGEDFTVLFNKLADKVKDHYYYGLNAAVYTQLSDVEIERNGIYTYDRRVLKPHSATGELKSKIEECINLPQSGVKVKTIISTSKEHKYKWRYTTSTDVPRRWFAKEFDDRSWQEGEAAFGKTDLWNAKELVSTPWDTPQIYMRRWFYLGDITPEMVDAMRFLLYHDDDIHIYINGVWAASKKGSVSNYIPFDISYEAKQTLKPNSWNLIAVEGIQGGGVQIMDLGISTFSTEDFNYTERYDDLSNPDYSEIVTPGNPAMPVFTKLAKPVPEEPSALSITNGQFCHTADRSNVAWGDYDNDGYFEIAYSGKDPHQRTASAKKASVLYDYDGKGSFARLDSPFDVCYHACPVWFDYNNDGLLDLFVPGLKSMEYENNLEEIAAFLYQNKGAGQDGKYLFEEVNAATPTGNKMGISPIYSAMDGGRSRQWVSVGDYDKDGYLDLVIAGLDDYEDPDGKTDEKGNLIVHHDRRVLYLYKNNQGKGFIRQETPLNGTKPFTGLSRGSVHFADMDNDGWLDIVSSGYGPGEGNLRIYWNNGDGTFSENKQYMYGSNDSSTSLCDLDADGRMDIVVTGFSRNKGSNGKSFYIYRNRGDRNFEMLNDRFCGFEGVDGATPSFGDVNHDGLPDILIGGHGEKHEITTWLYINGGDFDFKSTGAYYNTDQPWTFDRISHGNNHLIDYNNDGYLDAWNMGWAQNNICSFGCATQLWKNTSSTAGIKPNEAPSTPYNLKSSYNKATGMVTFTWDAATDDATPSEALQYNIYVKKSGSKEYFMTVPADLKTGFIKVGEISGQVMTTSYSMYIDNENAEYEWGVQAIDNGKKGGKFALSSFNPATTGMRGNLLSEVCVYSANGDIHYDVSENTILEIINAAGTSLSRASVSGNGVFSGLEKGVYLVSAIIGRLSRTFKLVL